MELLGNFDWTVFLIGGWVKGNHRDGGIKDASQALFFARAAWLIEAGVFSSQSV